MSAQKNKRKDKRFASNEPIVFSFFGTRLWHEFQSLTCNHSKYGMCFESLQRMSPGTNLFIRLDKDLKLDLDIDRNVYLRNTTLAKVKWCRESSGENRTHYSIGVRYC